MIEQAMGFQALLDGPSEQINWLIAQGVDWRRELGAKVSGVFVDPVAQIALMHLVARQLCADTTFAPPAGGNGHAAVPSPRGEGSPSSEQPGRAITDAGLAEEMGYPPSLVLAAGTEAPQYNFYGRLRTGEAIIFASVEPLNDGWLRLHNCHTSSRASDFAEKSIGNVEVHLSDLVWVSMRRMGDDK